VVARFLERAQKHCFHELRGRIGTVVNFAAVLEHGPTSGPETVDVARRIRTNAQSTVRMLQFLGSALELAARPPQRRSTDLRRLAQAILTEAGGQGTVQSTSRREPTADLDADLVAFVWRAFVSMQAEPAGCPIRGSSVSLASTPQECEVVLRLATDESMLLESDAPEVDVQSYARLGPAPAPLENALALTLAQHLVASHDGRMAVWGRPGARSGLRLALPLHDGAGMAL
jgi:hypothetical protein